MNDDIEKFLKDAPLAPPTDSLDRKIESLMAARPEPDAGARGGLFAWRIPAWGAGLACVVCFLIGQAVSGLGEAPRDVVVVASSENSVSQPGAATVVASAPIDRKAAERPTLIYVEAATEAADEVFNFVSDRDGELFFAATHRFKPKG
jgi:hypothetical protein